MRHLGSLLAGLFIAPVVWLLLAIGQPRTTGVFERWVDHNAYDTKDLIGPMAYITVAGLLFGLIAALRISPLGPTVAGTLYAVVYVVMFIDPLWGLDHIPSQLDLPLVDAQPQVPLVNGSLAVICLCLLTAAFSAQRWHRWPSQAPAEPEAVVAAPNGIPISSIWPPSLPALPAAPAPAIPQPTIRILSGDPETTQPTASTAETTLSLGNGAIVEAATEPLPRRTETPSVSPWTVPPSSGNT